MTEKLPGDKDLSQPNPERSKFHDLEVRREAIANQLKTLMEEEQKLVARIDAEEALDRLSEINRDQAILIEQLGAIEREIAAKQK